MIDFTNNWTILDEGGASAVSFNVFVNMDVKTENKIMQSPVEQGGFVAYNKLQTPLEIGLQVAIKGDNSELEDAIKNLLTLSSSTQLVSLITPEQEYKSLNLTKLAYRRTAEDGVDVIFVDCGLTEVRQVTSEYINARVATRKNRGKQQTKETSIIVSLFKGKTNA